MHERYDLLGESEILDPVWIPMSDGARLAARIILPRSASQRPVPAVLEYLPYRRGDGTPAPLRVASSQMSSMPTTSRLGPLPGSDRE